MQRSCIVDVPSTEGLGLNAKARFQEGSVLRSFQAQCLGHFGIRYSFGNSAIIFCGAPQTLRSMSEDTTLKDQSYARLVKKHLEVVVPDDPGRHSASNHDLEYVIAWLHLAALQP